MTPRGRRRVIVKALLVYAWAIEAGFYPGRPRRRGRPSGKAASARAIAEEIRRER